MKIGRAFCPIGNMINRQYKAHRNLRNLLFTTGICQNMYEVANVAMGKPMNPANITVGSANILLGMANKFAARGLQGDYLKIVERAKNINFIKSVRQGHTNTAAEDVIKLLTSA